jgi:hypothetical protein
MMWMNVIGSTGVITAPKMMVWSGSWKKGLRWSTGGQLPHEISLLSNLEVISFYSKFMESLESMFPVDVAMELPLLREISFAVSVLTGAIPSSLGLFSKLTSLDLSDNELTSTIPTELGLLSNLTTLILSKNKLSGTIPEELGSLTFLTSFQVDANANMEAPVPSGFCTEDHLGWMNLETDWCVGSGQCCTGI